MKKGRQCQLTCLLEKTPYFIRQRQHLSTCKGQHMEMERVEKWKTKAPEKSKIFRSTTFLNKIFHVYQHFSRKMRKTDFEKPFSGL